ncbi:MAG: WYL domain-containing protein [Thalassotalea sp.]|nr:WYL domain-containing protein [Thalassotalea sp.]
MSAFQRRLDLLDFIPRQPRKISTRQLLDLLSQNGHDHITIRSIQRDLEGMEKLGLFGLEVDKRSKPFGWYINNQWKKLNVSLMDANTALAFSTLEQQAQSLLPESTLQDLQAYFDKANTILSSEQTPLISQWKKSVAMITNPLPIITPTIDKETLSLIKHALFHKKQMSANLKRFFKTSKSQVWKDYKHINPLGLIHTDGMPILICTFGKLHQGYYTFPISSIKDVVIEDNDLCTPNNFDFEKVTAKYLNNPGKKQDIQLVIKIRKDSTFILRDAKLSHDQKVIECSNPDFVQISATVKDSAQLKAFLRGLGHGVEVIAPEKLRQYFKEIAQKLTNMYELNANNESPNKPKTAAKKTNKPLELEDIYKPLEPELIIVSHKHYSIYDASFSEKPPEEWTKKKDKKEKIHKKDKE